MMSSQAHQKGYCRLCLRQDERKHSWRLLLTVLEQKFILSSKSTDLLYFSNKLLSNSSLKWKMGIAKLANVDTSFLTQIRDPVDIYGLFSITSIDPCEGVKLPFWSCRPCGRRVQADVVNYETQESVGTYQDRRLTLSIDVGNKSHHSIVPFTWERNPRIWSHFGSQYFSGSILRSGAGRPSPRAMPETLTGSDRFPSSLFTLYAWQSFLWDGAGLR